MNKLVLLIDSLLKTTINLTIVLLKIAFIDML